MHNLTPLQTKLLKILVEETSQGHPFTGVTLGNRLELRVRKTGKDGADLRSIVNALRSKGFPICADTNGYWYPATEFELSAYITKFQARIDDQQKAVDGMKQGFDKIGRLNIKIPVAVIDPVTRTVRYEQQGLFQ